jgi:hypothetical protein
LLSFTDAGSLPECRRSLKSGAQPETRNASAFKPAPAQMAPKLHHDAALICSDFMDIGKLNVRSLANLD